MISILEAKNIIEQFKPELTTEEIDIRDALGYVIAQNIIAPSDSPSFDNSSMDGFGIRYEDVQFQDKNNPVKLRIVGESRAGVPFIDKIKNDEAIRISTGAAITPGIDTVIPLEDADYTDDFLSLKESLVKGQFIRYAGEDFKKGTEILKVGTQLNPPQLALLASVGIQNVKVFKNPSVAIITTGTELVPIHKNPNEFQIRDSNSVMIMSALRFSGVAKITHSHVDDSLDAIISLIAELSKDYGIIIISGGVSVGLHDYVRKASAAVGFKERFWKVNQKPGKPFYFATKDEQILFGLPGNPVSAYMVYIYYVHPLIYYLRGLDFKWRIVSARMNKSFTNTANRTLFARIKLSNTDILPREVDVLQNQGSHIITSISSSDGFIIVKGKQTIEENKIVEVYLFPWKY